MSLFKREIRLGSREEREQRAKHGLNLTAVTVLWSGPVLTLPSTQPGELRHLAIGLIEGRHWTVVYAPRGDTLRLISARRSRLHEKKLFQKLTS